MKGPRAITVCVKYEYGCEFRCSSHTSYLFTQQRRWPVVALTDTTVQTDRIYFSASLWFLKNQNLTVCKGVGIKYSQQTQITLTDLWNQARSGGLKKLKQRPKRGLFWFFFFFFFISVHLDSCTFQTSCVYEGHWLPDLHLTIKSVYMDTFHSSDQLCV